MITLGNDISNWQGNVNFDVFKNNTQFVIVKASESTDYKDLKLTRNQAEARRVGLALGYYHFARPERGNAPEKEAQWFLDCIGEVKEGELLCLDYEVAFANGVDWCLKFLKYIESKLNGYRPLIYMDQSRVSGLNWKPVVDNGNGLWIAAYTYDPNKNTFKKGAWPFAAMQQWSNNQIVPGTAAGIDGNVFFGDLATLKKYGYKKPAPTPTPEDPKDKQIKELQKQLEDANKATATAKKEGEATLALFKAQCQNKIDITKAALSELENLVKS